MPNQRVCRNIEPHTSGCVVCFATVKSMRDDEVELLASGVGNHVVDPTAVLIIGTAIEDLNSIDELVQVSD